MQKCSEDVTNQRAHNSSKGASPVSSSCLVPWGSVSSFLLDFTFFQEKFHIHFSCEIGFFKKYSISFIIALLCLCKDRHNFITVLMFVKARDSVPFSQSVVSNSLGPHGCRLPCLSPNPGVYSNACPLSQWCHPTISFSVVCFSSRLQSFPASRSFPISQFFASGGQSTGASALASVLPFNIQDWFSLGWIGWIFLQSKGLPRIFYNTTVQKHQFFNTQLSL